MDKQNKIFLLAFVIVVILILYFGRASDIKAQKQAELNNQHEIEQIAKDYNDGLWYLENRNFKDAEIKLNRFKDGKYNNDEKYKDAQILSIYATARYDEHRPDVYYRMQYQMANDELSKIPDDYNGQFVKDIKRYKQDVKDRLEVYAQTDKEHAKERETHIFVGDPYVKVTQLWGEPIRKNRTVVGNTVREQWVYGNGNYIYIENGLVTGWQDSK